MPTIVMSGVKETISMTTLNLIQIQKNIALYSIK